MQKPCGDAPRRCAGREGGALGEGKLRGAEQRRGAGPRLTQVRGAGQGEPVRGAGPGEAGEVRRRGHLGRAGRRRPGSPQALSGAEGGGSPFPPCLPRRRSRRAGPPLTCVEVEGDAGLGEVGGVALGADAADGSAVDVLLGRCRH